MSTLDFLKLRNVYPSLRMGQIICNSLGITQAELFYISDSELFEKLLEFNETASNTILTQPGELK